MDGVDFYVYGHLPIHIGGVTVYITTTHICLAIVMAALIIFAIAANRKIKKADPTKAPTGFLNVIELLVETLDNLVKSTCTISGCNTLSNTRSDTCDNC